MEWEARTGGPMVLAVWEVLAGLVADRGVLVALAAWEVQAGPVAGLGALVALAVWGLLAAWDAPELFREK